LDNGQLNLYDAIYGGPRIPLTEAPVANTNWSPDPWDLTNFNMGDFAANHHASAQSVLSLSDESLSSGEEMASSEMGLSVSSLDYTNTLVPPGTAARATPDGFPLDGLDDGFGL
jgi:hypothetical protein